MPALTLRRQHTPLPFQYLPFDVLAPILSHLTDRRDWYACCLVSKAFARIATPFLYRILESRRLSNKNYIHHPSNTILKRPDLARHVRHVTETVSVHQSITIQRPRFTRDTLHSLSLCKNLKSMTWIDDSISTDESLLLAYITVLRRLPLKELTIRTHNELGETVWTQLTTLTGLSKISLWCMEGPPRILQGLDSGWAAPLGSTLTHLELGVSAFCYPPTELLSQLPLLRDLRLKGAPAGSIQTILRYLPNLQSLDTEYLLLGSGSGFGRWNSTPQSSRLFGLNGLNGLNGLGFSVPSGGSEILLSNPAPTTSNSFRGNLKTSQTPSAPHSVWSQFGGNHVPPFSATPVADLNIASPSPRLSLGLGLGLDSSLDFGLNLTSDGLVNYGSFAPASHSSTSSLSHNWISNSNANYHPSLTTSTHAYSNSHRQRHALPLHSHSHPPLSSSIHRYSNIHPNEYEVNDEMYRLGSIPSGIHMVHKFKDDVVGNDIFPEPELPALKHLTVRTSVVSSQKLWTWISDLVPGDGLETFRLHALSYGNMKGMGGFGLGTVAGGLGGTPAACGAGKGLALSVGMAAANAVDSDVPRQFIADLARLHGSTLREFDVGEATLSLEDVYQLSTLFPMLEVLVCGVAATDSTSIIDALKPAKNLQSLRLHVRWVRPYTPPTSPIESHPHTRSIQMQYTKYLPPSYSHSTCAWHSSFVSPDAPGSTLQSKNTSHALNFTIEDAKKMMAAHEDSKLRVISIGPVRYAGKWELEDSDEGVSLFGSNANNCDTFIAKTTPASTSSPSSSYAVTSTSSSNSDYPRAKRLKLSGGARDASESYHQINRVSKLRFVVSESIAEDKWRT